MLSDARTMKSDAFFWFTVAARANVLPHWQIFNNGIINQKQIVKEATETSSWH
jgi:hypothetical protein